MSLYSRILFSFRELFVYHNDAIEFRAKVFALVVGANSDNGECEIEQLKEIIKKIYFDNHHRQHTFILIVQEYIEKIRLPNGLGIDELVIDIEKILSDKNRFVKKINLEYLNKLLECTKEQENLIYQKRILEFLKKTKLRYA
jgi:hypothetical protein